MVKVNSFEEEWGLTYYGNRLHSIIRKGAENTEGISPSSFNAGSVFYWNEGTDGYLRRICMYPSVTHGRINGKVWKSLAKTMLSNYDATCVGENSPFLWK